MAQRLRTDGTGDYRARESGRRLGEAPSALRYAPLIGPLTLLVASSMRMPPFLVYALNGKTTLIGSQP